MFADIGGSGSVESNIIFEVISQHPWSVAQRKCFRGHSGRQLVGGGVDASFGPHQRKVIFRLFPRHFKSFENLSVESFIKHGKCGCFFFCVAVDVLVYSFSYSLCRRLKLLTRSAFMKPSLLPIPDHLAVAGVATSCQVGLFLLFA